MEEDEDEAVRNQNVKPWGVLIPSILHGVKRTPVHIAQSEKDCSEENLKGVPGLSVEHGGKVEENCQTQVLPVRGKTHLIVNLLYPSS